MKILSWNVRGMRNPRTFRAFIQMLKFADPDVVFLMETKLLSRQSETFRVRCNMFGCFGVDLIGLSGGLALLWKQGINVAVESFSPGHIDSVITHPMKGSFRMMGFYGNPDSAFRYLSWQLLEKLKSVSNLGWFIMGDFNEILKNDDKLGGRPCSGCQIDRFRTVIDSCSLRPLPFTG